MSCDSNLSYRETKLLAFKLRREDPQQFQTLVRMHLSFILELVETEGSSSKTKSRPLKWGKVHFSKKIKTPEREISDNAPISSGILPQINTLVDFLSKEENVSQEGIFRRSGKVTRQQELKNLLRQGECPELNDGPYSVHDVATVLKGFLADLSEPLLTDLYYPAYCHVADLCRSDNGSKSRVLRALQLLFLLLPIENRKVLKRILELLHLTAGHVSTNRMSSQNLATLFTPHLLCPRKLSPENFHKTAQSLSCVVVFIINHAKEVFEIPPSLATDIKAYWDRRQRTPDHLLERSMSESTAANTVFSFVNREMSAADSNPTETALAQLYAHIQGLPESSKKKRLIKQFNKENGQGTPRTKSIGVSIKKHIFCKNAKAKGYHEFGQIKNGSSSSDEMINSPPEIKTPMRYKDLDDKDSLDTRCIKAGMKRFQTALESETDESPPKIVCERSREEPEAGGKERTGKMVGETEGLGRASLERGLRGSGRFYSPAVGSRGSGGSHPYSPLQLARATASYHGPSSPLITPRGSGGSAHYLLTPAPLGARNSNQGQTPAPAGRASAHYHTPSPMCTPAHDDMSPITMSAQRMPKAMQEAMITPRSRKPVVALSGSNLCQLGTRDWTTKEIWRDGEGVVVCEEVSEDEESLSSPFKDYLFSRSVLTTSPHDLSFSSQPGDFDQSSSSAGSGVELGRGERPDLLDRPPLTESLLYFLDGASPPSGMSLSGSPRSDSSTPPITETAL